MIRRTLDHLSSRNGKLREALSVLDDADHYRNLHVSFVICIFFASAAMSAVLCFYLIELCVWLRIDDYAPLIPVFISYIALFVVWALMFLAILSALESVGVKNIGSVAEARLAKLTLNSAELERLREAVAARTWRHAHIVKTVVDRLAQEPAGLQH